MKPKAKITISEINKLNVIDEEILWLGIKNNIPEFIDKLNNRSLFDKFYDSISNFLSKGKSFVTDELKPFV